MGRLVLHWVCVFALVALPVGGCSDETTAAGGTGGTGGAGGSGDTRGDGGTGGNTSPESYAGNVCVGAKQAATATFCQTVFDASATWATDLDGDARVALISAAASDLGNAWDEAESDAAGDDANCSDLALTSGDASLFIEVTGAASVVGTITDGLDLGQSDEAACAAALLTAAGDACSDVLAAEAAHVADLYADRDSSTLNAAKGAASDAFLAVWADATSGNCPTNAIDTDVRDDLLQLTDTIVSTTIVTPGLSDAQFTQVRPGQTEYLGRTYDPQCMQGDDYRFFGRRGSVNKLVMYYMGGGACWDNLTCGGVPEIADAACTTSPPATLDSFSSGFADLTNENNPFRDWNIVFVSYCSCDVHFGDETQDYGDVTVQHKGYHNSRVAEKWAREHFLNPEEVFVTGSSAGGYAAWFHGPLLHEVWPASQVHVLADAGNGVATPEFLQNEFSNWGFVKNLPDIPGVLEAVTGTAGLPAYAEAVAAHFPDTNWAHYSTMYDGPGGGQTGFYNVMLEMSPLGALVWWEASCQFGEVALAQSIEISATVSNYRFYFGTGSRHTMFRNDKVYDDTTGDVPTIVDWVNGMLASRPDAPDDGWTNVLCTNCGLLLDGDPRPEPLQPPFTQQGEDVVIVCE